VRALPIILALAALALPARAAERFTPSGAWRTPHFVRSASDGIVHVLGWSWPGSARFVNGQSAWVRLGAPAAVNKIPRNSCLLEATDFRFHIPRRAIVRGVAVEIRARAGRRHAGTTSYEAVFLLVNGIERGENRAVGLTLSRRMSTFAYGRSDDLWGLAEQLTPEHIDDVLFGVALAIRNPKRPAAAAVDGIRMAVFYDLP
jgi:hypothetical protein